MRRVTPFVGAAVLVALATAALVLAGRHPDESLANGSGAVIALEAVTAALLIGAGLGVRPPHAGFVYSATALAFAANVLPLPDAGGSLFFTFALVVGGGVACLAALGALELDGRAPWQARGIAGVSIAACILWVGLIPAMLFDPKATGCFGCPRNLVLVHGAERLRTQSLHAGLYAAAAASAVTAAAVLVAAAARRTHWSRRTAFAGATIALGASAFAFWHRVAHPATSRPGRLAWLVECAGLAVVAAAPLTEMLRARRERARIVDTVLRTVPSAEDLRIALAASAGDGALVLVFPYGDNAVDGDGLPAPPSGNRAAITDVTRGGEVVAQLRHRVLGSQASQRLAGAVHAAGLALEHTSSRARLRAQLGDLTSSRARVVEIADAERRRLERNLHDGAQQRLIALSVALASPGDPTAAEARDEVLAALDELRAIAHGIHPVSLSDGGIVASVRELADTTTVPMRLELRRLDRLPEQLEAAAYRVVADCVRAAEQSGSGGAVSIELEMTERGLDAQVRLPGVTRAAAERALLHATDRVTAAGGHVNVSERGDEAVVELRL